MAAFFIDLVSSRLADVPSGVQERTLIYLTDTMTHPGTLVGFQEGNRILFRAEFDKPLMAALDGASEVTFLISQNEPVYIAFTWNPQDFENAYQWQRAQNQEP